MGWGDLLPVLWLGLAHLEHLVRYLAHLRPTRFDLGSRDLGSRHAHDRARGVLTEEIVPDRHTILIGQCCRDALLLGAQTVQFVQRDLRVHEELRILSERLSRLRVAHGLARLVVLDLARQQDIDIADQPNRHAVRVLARTDNREPETVLDLAPGAPLEHAIFHGLVHQAPNERLLLQVDSDAVFGFLPARRVQVNGLSCEGVIALVVREHPALDDLVQHRAEREVPSVERRQAHDARQEPPTLARREVANLRDRDHQTDRMGDLGPVRCLTRLPADHAQVLLVISDGEQLGSHGLAPGCHSHETLPPLTPPTTGATCLPGCLPINQHAAPVRGDLVLHRSPPSASCTSREDTQPSLCAA